MQSERSRDPGKIQEYYGRILAGGYSAPLTQRVSRCLAAFRAFDQTGCPAMPYVCAWGEEGDTIWYEFASTRFLDLMKCKPARLANVLGKSIMGCHIYRYSDLNVGVEKKTLGREELIRIKNHLREAGKKTGLVEAVYKLALKHGTTVSLKDRANIELYPEDRICLSMGNLVDVSKEMEAEDQCRIAEEELSKANVQVKEANRRLSLAYGQMREWKDRLSTQLHGDDIGFLIDENGCILGVTEKGLEMAGKASLTILGSGISDLLDATSRDTLREGISKAWLGMSYRLPLHFLDRESRLKTFDTKFTAINMKEGKTLLLLMRPSDKDGPGPS